MKYFVCTLLWLLLAFHAQSQVWKDSLRVARKAYQSENYERSFSAYLSTEKIAPKTVDLSAEKGQAAYKAAKLKESEKIYTKKATSNTSSQQQKAASYHNLGNTKYKQEKYNEAIEAYKQALRKNPEDLETRYNLAQALKKKKEQEKKQQKKDSNKDKSKSNEPKKDSNESKSETKSKQKPSQNQKNTESSSKNDNTQLSDKQNEKLLNDLAKQETQTKRKMQAKRTKSSSNKSGKDW